MFNIRAKAGCALTPSINSSSDQYPFESLSTKLNIFSTSSLLKLTSPLVWWKLFGLLGLLGGVEVVEEVVVEVVKVVEVVEVEVASLMLLLSVLWMLATLCNFLLLDAEHMHLMT